MPRHIFIDEALSTRAYEDTALPIGHGQTISQPFIVALMTKTLLNKPRERVLEIGTGSGYQTAVLAALVKRVFTVERIAPLIERARERFRAMKLRNVRVKYDDGNMGWPDQGPFDGIIVTAAARSVPDALLEQLAVGRAVGRFRSATTAGRSSRSSTGRRTACAKKASNTSASYRCCAATIA